MRRFTRQQWVILILAGSILLGVVGTWVTAFVVQTRAQQAKAAAKEKEWNERAARGLPAGIARADAEAVVRSWGLTRCWDSATRSELIFTGAEISTWRGGCFLQLQLRFDESEQLTHADIVEVGAS